MGWNEAVDAILSLKDLAVNAVKIIIKLLKSFPKFFSIFTYVTDPVKIIKDIVFGIKSGFMMILNFIYSNTIGRIISLFVSSSTESSKEKSQGRACVTNTFIQTLILVLCPPLALFLRKGLPGILNIIIASVLTYFYYVPGLIYSALYIL